MSGLIAKWVGEQATVGWQMDQFKNESRRPRHATHQTLSPWMGLRSRYGPSEVFYSEGGTYAWRIVGDGPGRRGTGRQSRRACPPARGVPNARLGAPGFAAFCAG